MSTETVKDSMTEKMRALVSGRGPDGSLDDVPVPQSGPGQVLVRNRASATNNADLPMLAETDPPAAATGASSLPASSTPAGSAPLEIVDYD